MLDSIHRRFNPLSGEWVLVSPHRSERPWLDLTEKKPPDDTATYDPDCYLCPGNYRAGGVKNPQYTGTFVFDNDFSALLPNINITKAYFGPNSLFQAEVERGLCRVVCFSPRHDLTMPELDLTGIENIIVTWIQQTNDLSHYDFIKYVQVFENKGAIMGCSNPHPHSQIWATEHVPNEPLNEFTTQKAYLNTNNSSLLMDYVNEEHDHKERIVAINNYFTALVPFWAIWPFEILLVAHRPLAYLTDLASEEVSALADLLKCITTKYDNLFETSFPYTMGFHQAPLDGLPHPEWVLHAHFYPPLLRSATIRKFMVGYEMLAMPQRDITSEIAAEQLRRMSQIHYRVR